MNKRQINMQQVCFWRCRHKKSVLCLRARLGLFVRSLAHSLAPELSGKKFLFVNWMSRFHTVSSFQPTVYDAVQAKTDFWVSGGGRKITYDRYYSLHMKSLVFHSLSNVKIKKMQKKIFLMKFFISKKLILVFWNFF